MKLSRTLFAAALLTAVACGQAVEQAGTAAVERAVSEVTISEGTPVTTADLKIDGMTCMMSCGRSIEKALAALPGVSNTEIVFNEGEEADHAIVTYDESKVNDAQLIEAVGKVHEGAYKVLAVRITKQVKGDAPAEAPPADPAAAQPTEASVEEEPAVGELVTGLLALLSKLARV